MCRIVGIARGGGAARVAPLLDLLPHRGPYDPAELLPWVGRSRSV